MTVVWFPKIDKIRGDSELKDAWKKLRDIMKDRCRTKFNRYENPIEWVIVLQQRNRLDKAIIFEKITYIDEYIGFVKENKVPEWDGESEVRFFYLLYDKDKKNWESIEEKEKGYPALIPISDFERLIRIYNFIKQGLYKEIVDEEGLERI